MKGKFPFRVLRADLSEQLVRDKERAERRASDAETRTRQVRADYEKRLEQLAKLADDMKLIGVHVFRDYERQSLRCCFEISHETLWASLRMYDKGSRDMIAYMIERELVRNQDTRKAYYGA